MLGFDRLQLDGNFFAGCHIRSKINISKRTRPNLTTKPVLFAHTQLHLGVQVYGWDGSKLCRKLCAWMEMKEADSVER